MLDLDKIEDPELLLYCKKVKDLNLTLSDFHEHIVMDFLLNPYSAYQDFVIALCDKLLKDRKTVGIPTPIDNVKSSYHNFYNAKYNTNNTFFTRFSDMDVLRDAFMYRWHEKNQGSDLTTFDEIAPYLDKSKHIVKIPTKMDKFVTRLKFVLLGDMGDKPKKKKNKNMPKPNSFFED